LKRTRIEVRHRGDGWQLVNTARQVLGWQPTKAGAVSLGSATCRAILREGGLAQLIVKNKNGRIAKGGHGERTYGKDPRRSRG
jgi:hypothetical protein